MGDEERRFLTLGVDLGGVPTLVVGGGAVGIRKARLLLEHGAQVTVVDPWLSEHLAPEVHAGRVRWIQGSYSVGHLRGYSLIIASTSDSKVNQRIADDAHRRGRLCCLVSDRTRSRVLFPAMHQWGDVTVALHTNARNCRTSVRAREHLASLPEPPAEAVTVRKRDGG
jgi:siroheme synthase-like protein